MPTEEIQSERGIEVESWTKEIQSLRSQIKTMEEQFAAESDGEEKVILRFKIETCKSDLAAKLNEMRAEGIEIPKE